MTRLYLIRHGENTDGQVSGQGPTVDLWLSEQGRTQVERRCARLKTGLEPQASVLLLQETDWVIRGLKNAAVKDIAEWIKNPQP